MSVEIEHADTLLKLAVILCVLAGSGVVLADEEPAPDLEFLEYLGSWEDSDEDWVLLAAEVVEQKEIEDKDEANVPAPDGKKLAEMADEN
jgi:hypothetical protein